MKAKNVSLILAFFYLLSFSGDLFSQSRNDITKCEVFYFGDNAVLGTRKTNDYVAELQKNLSAKFSSEKISVINCAYLNFSTSQIYEAALTFLNNESDSKNKVYAIFMGGASNFYNLTGYSSYLQKIGKYKPQASKSDFANNRSTKKLAKLIAKEYNDNFLAKTKEGNGLNQIFSTATHFLSNKKHSNEVDSQAQFAQITPRFTILSINNIDRSSIIPDSQYSKIWDAINLGDFNSADRMLNESLVKYPSDSKLYYSKGTLLLFQNKESEALRFFEDGILVDPFNAANLCYKGLGVVFISYEGDISDSALTFSLFLKEYIGEQNGQISSIAAMKGLDHSDKIASIKEWILYDVNRLYALCKRKNIEFIISDYPRSQDFGKLLEEFKRISNNILIADNSNVQIDDNVSKNLAQNIAKIIR
ncbi:MAG: hypothetical protein LBU55_03160 [Elusimicrobiota bacterium]|jgi:hypothetical protein|nr:hypothetical protein [Elusimicrobiota bacterium]